MASSTNASFPYLSPELHLLIASKCLPRTRFSLLLALSNLEIFKNTLRSALLEHAASYSFSLPDQHPPYNGNIGSNDEHALNARNKWEEGREKRERFWALEWTVAKLLSGPSEQIEGWIRWGVELLMERTIRSNVLTQDDVDEDKHVELATVVSDAGPIVRSEEHTSELQSREK